MPDIVLTTLNAKYAHSALGLRYLAANLGDLRDRAALVEFTIHERPADIVEQLLAHQPKIVGVGVYIWNTDLSLQVVQLLKRIRPDLFVVLGGPEVSYDSEEQEIVATADYTVAGEADIAFADLCRKILGGQSPSDTRIVRAPPPATAQLRLPYNEYTDVDVRERTIYVEASRGCPFSCEFCLSSLDIPVRQFDLSTMLVQFDALIERGVRQFKFVDRTFNLKMRTAEAILEFFLDRIDRGLFVHFEMVPDRLPEGLRELIARFPAGTLQFEVGIQSFDPDTSARISRKQDLDKLDDNLRFLREHTGVHVHADLIVGLPGEDLTTFAAGFDRLVALAPQEIQVGILKKLRGTPIGRHDGNWEAIFSPTAPYEILCNKLISFAEMQAMKRFARAWDLVANSGNFRDTAPRLWRSSSPFAGFAAFTEWLLAQAGHFKGIALDRLARYLFDYLTLELGQSAPSVAADLARDYGRPGRRLPGFLSSFHDTCRPIQRPVARGTPRRQARHL